MLGGAASSVCLKGDFGYSDIDPSLLDEGRISWMEGYSSGSGLRGDESQRVQLGGMATAGSPEGQRHLEHGARDLSNGTARLEGWGTENHRAP